MFTQCEKEGKKRVHLLDDRRFFGKEPKPSLACRIGPKHEVDISLWQLSETTLADWLANPKHCFTCRRRLIFAVWDENWPELVRRIDAGDILRGVPPVDRDSSRSDLVQKGS